MRSKITIQYGFDEVDGVGKYNSVTDNLIFKTSWEDIDELVKEAASKGDPIAQQIKKLKLEINHISLSLYDPYAESSENEHSSHENDVIPPMLVDIDLGLSAFANARR